VLHEGGVANLNALLGTRVSALDFGSSRYGGAPGVRDAGALESALHRPQTGYYDSIIHEAAALLESLVQNHPFIDGNKRVAYAVSLYLGTTARLWLDLQSQHDLEIARQKMGKKLERLIQPLARPDLNHHVA
jgi:plasmid maintenance system antidote protein VapI